MGTLKLPKFAQSTNFKELILGKKSSRYLSLLIKLGYIFINRPHRDFYLRIFAFDRQTYEDEMGSTNHVGQF